MAAGKMQIPATNLFQADKKTTNGPQAGSVIWAQVAQGDYKKFVAYLSTYENSGAAQTITFPAAFTYPPAITLNQPSMPGVTASTTQLSLNPANTTQYSGYVIVEGF